MITECILCVHVMVDVPQTTDSTQWTKKQHHRKVSVMVVFLFLSHDHVGYKIFNMLEYQFKIVVGPYLSFCNKRHW